MASAAAGCPPPPLLKNLQPTLCMFCFRPVPLYHIFRLEECGHIFCRGCLQFAVEMQTESMEIPCLVWYFKKCEGFLKDTEVRQLVSPEMYQKYIDRSLIVAKKKMKNVFSCKTEGCGGWCEFEVGRRTFICPVCNQINCMTCNTIHPFGVSCDLFQKSTSYTRQYWDRGRNITKVQVNNNNPVQKEKVTGWGQLVQMVKSSGNSFKIEQTDLLVNTSEFECPICFTDTPPGEGVILHECLHLFCKNCLIRLVDLSEDPSVKCPFVDDSGHNCCFFLQPREIKALVPEQIHEKYLQKSMTLGESSSENTFHCKTPDCPGWCFYDEGVTRFICPSCRKRNCIPCQAIHDRISCADYKRQLQQNHNNERLSEATVEMLIRQGLCMRCPKCKIPLQKVAGCDWLQCSVCKTEICWVTRGARWGPKGRGDRSGGCGCAPMRRCHPHCTGCH